MCSIMGMLLLLAAAFFLGRGMGKREKRYLQLMRWAVEMLRHIRRKIDLFAAPSGEIFSELRTPEGLVLSEERMQQILAEMGSDGEVLRHFFEKLGSSYREDTLRLCDDTAAGLEQHLKTAEREYPARAKLYTAMPLLIAVSIIVLIL